MGGSDAIVDVEQRLADLGLTLPPPGATSGRYAKAVRWGDLLFVSGHLPDSSEPPIHVGKLGRDLTTPQGYEAARQAGLSLLASVRTAVGDLNRVRGVLKLFGMVNSTESFIEQSQVINGVSDLLHEIFGEAALHARSAVGMAQLPRNNCVEIEAVIEVAGA
jgi:enamine deaminase RidA (YjgF/YER057c/UK114 family)